MFQRSFSILYDVAMSVAVKNAIATRVRNYLIFKGSSCSSDVAMKF